MSDNLARALDGTLNRTPRSIVPVEPVLEDQDGHQIEGRALMAAGIEQRTRQEEQQ